MTVLAHPWQPPQVGDTVPATQAVLTQKVVDRLKQTERQTGFRIETQGSGKLVLGSEPHEPQAAASSTEQLFTDEAASPQLLISAEDPPQAMFQMRELRTLASNPSP